MLIGRTPPMTLCRARSIGSRWHARWLDGGEGLGTCAIVRPCGSVVKPSAGASTDGSDGEEGGGCFGARALDICAPLIRGVLCCSQP